MDRLKYYISFYRDCLILYNDRYAAQPKKQKGVLSLGFPKVCSSPIGNVLCELFALDFSGKEVNGIRLNIRTIQLIIDRIKENIVLSHLKALIRKITL